MTTPANKLSLKKALSFRSPLFWLGVLLLALAWLLVGPRSVTTVELDTQGDKLSGTVNSAMLALDTKGGALPLTSTVALYTAPPETSQYYQPGETAGPLGFIGALGELIQQARPGADWSELRGSTSIPSSGDTAALGQLPSTPYNLQADLIGGRVASGYVVGVAGGLQYAFTVRPERRNLSWWTFSQNGLVTQLASTSYRVAGWATVADLAQELALALVWTAVLALLAFGIARLLGFLPVKAGAPNPLPLPQRGRGVSLRLVGEDRSPHPNPSPAWRGALSWVNSLTSTIQQKLAALIKRPLLIYAQITPDLPSPRRRGAGGEVIASFHTLHIPINSSSPKAFSSSGKGLGLGAPAFATQSPPASTPEAAIIPVAANTSWLFSSQWLWALLFGILAFAAALWVCLGPLEGIPHVQDDVAYIFQAKIFAIGHAWVPAPPLPQFFKQDYIVINDGRWFAKYPPGWPVMLAPFERFGIDWIVNPLCAGLTVLLVYLTGRMIYGKRAAFWAGLLALASPFIIFMSGSFMSHPSTLFWLTLCLYCFIRSVAKPAWLAEAPNLPQNTRWRSLFLLALPFAAGFAASWALITREATALGVLIPFALWALVDLGAALRRGVRELGRRFRPYGLMIVGALFPLLVLAYADNAQMGSPFTLAQDLVGSYDRLGFGVGFGPEPEGHTLAIGLYNALVYLRELQAALFGWPLLLTLPPLLLALFALVSSLKNRDAKWLWDLLVFGGFFGLVGIYLAWWSSTTIYGPRYWYEGTAFLMLLAGRGIAWLGDIVGENKPLLAASSLVKWLAPGALVAVLLLYNVSQYLPGQIREYTGYNDVNAATLHRAEQANLQNALVFVALEPSISNRDFGKIFFANNPLLIGPAIYARDLGPAQNQKLLAQFPTRQAYYLPLDGAVKPGVGP